MRGKIGRKLYAIFSGDKSAISKENGILGASLSLGARSGCENLRAPNQIMINGNCDENSGAQMKIAGIV